MAIRLWIVGPDAVDIARLTGLPLNHLLDRRGTVPSINHAAVRDPDNMYLDLTRLSWWDRLRVAWARIGAHYYLSEGTQWSPPVSSSSESSAPSSTSPAASSKAKTSDQDRLGWADGRGYWRDPGRGALRHSMARVLSNGVASGGGNPYVDAQHCVWDAPTTHLIELRG